MRKAEKLNPMDSWLLGTALALLAVGLLIMFDASYKKAVDAPWANHDAWFFTKRQLAFAAVGLIGMLAASRVRLTTFLKLTLPVLVASVVLLGLVLVIGEPINGARRWLRIGPISFQPSELAKLAVVMYLSAMLAQRKNLVRRLSMRWVLPLVMLGLIAGLIFMEPDLGTTLAFVGVCFLMFFAGGAMKRHLLAVAAAGGGLVTVAVMTSDERMGRILTWLNPWRDYYGEGYQIIHSLVAHGTGGWFGVGLCEGREKAYLPAASTDFIFSTVAEEAGLIGGVVLLVLFGVLIYRGLDIARRSRSTYANLLAVGVTSMIGLQALINIAVVSALIPATGVPLPLISYGGSSLVFTLIAVGALLAVSRQADVELHDRDLYENSYDGWRDGRAYLPRNQHRAGASRRSPGSGTAVHR